MSSGCPGWGGSGFTIQYDGTPNLSYAAFLPVQVDESGAGRPDLDDEQRRLGELRAADLQPGESSSAAGSR